VDPNFIQVAINAADTLTNLIPPDLAAGIGHLLHMPGHAYTRAENGRYHDAVLANLAGSKDDAAYIRDCNINSNDYYRELYFSHKNAFLMWAALMSGESQTALEAADNLLTECNIVSVAEDIGGVFFSYPTWKQQALLKLGKFEELINQKMSNKSKNELIDMYTKAIGHFSKSYAHASLGQCDASFQEREEFILIASNSELRRVRIFMIHASDLLDLSGYILAGRLCRFCSNLLDDCSESKELAAAVDLQDTFPYMEPRYWPDNTRACLGSALLRGNKPDEALVVFEQDLALSENPSNGWSLKGKALALMELGLEEEAANTLDKFSEAWKFADFQIDDPCF